MPSDRKPWTQRPDAPQRMRGRAWQRLRAEVLLRDRYLCHCPDCQGGKLRIREADEVDHVVALAEWKRLHGSMDGCDDLSNLRAVSEDCHALLTMRQLGRNPFKGCDVNGMPLDPDHPWNTPRGASESCTEPPGNRPVPAALVSRNKSEK